MHDDDDVLIFSGSDGGILAVGSIDGERTRPPNPGLHVDRSNEQVEIDVRLVNRLRPPITVEQLRNYPVLTRIADLEFPEATYSRMTDAEWDAVTDLLRERALSKTRCVVVYVGSSSESNLAYSLPDGRWGWRNQQPEYEQIRPGDQILLALGFTGGSPRRQPDDFARYQFRRLLVGRVTAAVAKEADRYWPDETTEMKYPYRLSFEILKEKTSVHIRGPRRTLRWAGR